MTTPIRCTFCSAQGTFADEVKRLADRGLTATPHSDITRLQRGEYLVHTPVRSSSNKPVCVYFRE